VNGSVSFNPLWVDNTGLVTVFPTRAQLLTALNNVQVSAENVSATYANFTVNVDQAFFVYDLLVKVPFLQVVAQQNFGDIEAVLQKFFINVLFTGELNYNAVCCAG
jgi:hypothetical protein